MRSLLLDEDISDELDVEVGKKAPDFALLNQKGEEWKLSLHLGRVIALLFYPQNETLVCNRQLCSVRDQWQNYIETKALVVGISPASVNNHQSFTNKYKLPLPILADESGEVTSLYSKHWLMPVNFTRAVIVINAEGIICSRNIMLRVFRPADCLVISAIHAARAEELNNNYESIAARFRMLRNYRF